MRRIVKALAARYGLLTEAYVAGWEAGVNQHHYEPETSMYAVSTYVQYWGEEQ